MVFCGYNFKLVSDGSIEMDDEITPEKLGVIDGDRFKVSIVDNKVTLNKMPPIQIWEQD